MKACQILAMKDTSGSGTIAIAITITIIYQYYKQLLYYHYYVHLLLLLFSLLLLLTMVLGTNSPAGGCGTAIMGHNNLTIIGINKGKSVN